MIIKKVDISSKFFISLMGFLLLALGGCMEEDSRVWDVVGEGVKKGFREGFREGFNGSQVVVSIGSFADLEKIRRNPAGDYRVTADIDFGGKNFRPISSFTGTLDGNGKIFSNGLIQNAEGNGVGFFKDIVAGASIRVKDLTFKDFTVEGKGSVGVLAGQVNSASGSKVSVSAETVKNVRVEGGSLVIGYGGSSGGLVGKNYGKIVRSSSSIDIEISGYGGDNIGGLVGKNYGVIDWSNAVGDVSGKASEKVGGLVGRNYGVVSNSYAEGDIAGYEQLGGLVGYNVQSISYMPNGGLVSASYATGDITVKSQDVRVDGFGGLVGLNSNEGSIVVSYATGRVTGASLEVKSIGALVGRDYKTSLGIEQSYALRRGNNRLIGVKDPGAFVDRYSRLVSQAELDKLIKNKQVGPGATPISR